MSLLAIDVGAGTQDILLYREDIPLEGSTKMVLPSQTIIVGGRIEQAMAKGKDIFLQGPTMGGGASTASVRRHLAAGLKVYATPSAAATINDNLERVEALGVIIQEDAPDSAEVIETGDIDIPALEKAFSLFDLDLPGDVAVAVQDHGYSPEKSNRLVRFEHMAEAIRSGGKLEAFAYREPPEAMTRMLAVKEYLDRMDFSPVLMDTGPAAIFGAALDPRCQDPSLIINFGNGHTVAALLCDGRITALFEHHTSQLVPDKLRHFLDGLCSGDLKSSQVFKDGGHGAYIERVPEEVKSTLVTGPRRDQFLSSKVLDGAVAAAPGGDMMITGCLGLIEAWTKKDDLWR
ncbi:MAG TPA: DUF1786 domain-containing protein [Methanotrichaceae archaeon]|nr:DUF1786 domain-containing protein [Methanotrichaceae archaeon]